MPHCKKDDSPKFVDANLYDIRSLKYGPLTYQNCCAVLFQGHRYKREIIKMNQINGLLGCYQLCLLHDVFAKCESTNCYSIPQNSSVIEFRNSEIQTFRILNMF